MAGGRFWWDAAPSHADVYPLRAVIFDLDAVTDMECDGQRLAFNAAFAAHGLDIQWSVGGYRQLLALGDERKRVAASSRKRGIATECDVLTELLADDIYTTKNDAVRRADRRRDLSPRPGLVDLVMDAFAAGVSVGVVTKGPRSWAEPLIRHLVGDGIVETVVTADDVKKPLPDREAYQHALWELGIPAESALAVAGSASGCARHLRRSGHRGHHGRRHTRYPRRCGGAPRLCEWRGSEARGLSTSARSLVGRPQQVCRLAEQPNQTQFRGAIR